MPSQLHEVLLQLFRNRPELAPELLRDALHQELPSYTEARIDSADLSEVQPALAAQRASVNLDDGRAKLYRDLIFHSLSEAARRAFRTMMDISKQDDYESDFVKEFIDIGLEKGRMQGFVQGQAEGRVQGRAELVMRLLTIRFGTLGEEVMARIGTATPEQLDAIGERLLTARTLQEALG